MPLYWLVYRHDNQISVVIEPGASLVHARMRAALANLDQGEFTEGHELDRKWKVAKQMVGRQLWSPRYFTIRLKGCRHFSTARPAKDEPTMNATKKPTKRTP